MDFNELLSQFRTSVHSRAQAVSAHWTYTPNSTWANELRGGFTHYVLQILPSDIGFPYVINTGLTNPSLKGIPDVRIDGFTQLDRKSTRLNSSHQIISYAVFCLKKKKTTVKYSRHLNHYHVICSERRTSTYHSEQSPKSELGVDVTQASETHHHESQAIDDENCL